MIYYDFKIQKYFEDYRYLVAYINFSRMSSKISKKQMQHDNQISHATFRRAEVTNFVDHFELLSKLADYFGSSAEYDMEIIKELNNNFNLLYTYLYLNDLENMELYFKKIEEKKNIYEKSVLYSIYHFAKLIYYVSSPLRVEINAINESIEILKLFRDDLLDVFSFLLDVYIFCYYSLIHDKDNVVKYAKKVYLELPKYPRLVPMILYQMSLNYYLINDYANCIFYSLEALPKLEEDLNYNRAICSNLNIAICFERLNNTVKCREILNKIFLHMMSNKIPRFEYLVKLTQANCCVSEENYQEAIDIFKELEDKRNVKGENSLMLLYCYYKMNNKNAFENLALFLEDEFKNHNFYSGYYDVVLLLDAMIKHNKKAMAENLKIAEKSFSYYGDSKIVDLIYMEMKDKKIIQVPNNN